MERILQRLNDRVWVLRGSTNTGIIKLSTNNALLIDPGQDRDSVAGVMKAVEELGLKLSGVFITHAHADHFGGSAYLKSKENILFFASDFESALIEQPLLEPIFLYSGAEPISELKHKFILAKPVKITERITAGKWRFDGTSFFLMNLPGHSTGQMGLVIDDIVFCGDAITLGCYYEKYKFPFYSHIAKAFETFERLETVTCQKLVPGHGEVLNPATYLVEIETNRNYLCYFIETVLAVLQKNPLTEEELLRQLALRLQIALITVIQYSLSRTMVLAVLEYLKTSRKVRICFEDNRWLWIVINYKSGGKMLMWKQLDIVTTTRVQFQNISNLVQSEVKKSGIQQGVCFLFVPHTTAGITINENADPDVIRDITCSLADLIPENGNYRHSEGNSDAHLKASMMGFSCQIPIINRCLGLGTWQGIYFSEFDGPRHRKLMIGFIGT